MRQLPCLQTFLGWDWSGICRKEVPIVKTQQTDPTSLNSTTKSTGGAIEILKHTHKNSPKPPEKALETPSRKQLAQASQKQPTRQTQQEKDKKSEHTECKLEK